MLAYFRTFSETSSNI